MTSTERKTLNANIKRLEIMTDDGLRMVIERSDMPEIKACAYALLVKRLYAAADQQGSESIRREAARCYAQYMEWQQAGGAA